MMGHDPHRDPAIDKHEPCPACGKAMSNGVGCEPFAWGMDKGDMPRQRFGHHDDPPYASPCAGTSARWPCHDCGAPPGGYHYEQCDLDVCPHGQAILCPRHCAIVDAAPVS